MITIRQSSARGHANYGWLDTYHTFSFADYYDAAHMGFRDLRVINDDTVKPGAGFPEHEHTDMEIISYVLSGALRHSDSMGNGGVILEGEVQRISAGAGIVHSEVNASATVPVHFLQIWILPNTSALTPGYAQASFANAPVGALTLVASLNGRDGSLIINQNVDLYLGRVQKGGTLTHKLRENRYAWLQLIDGTLTINSHKIEAGDGAAVHDETELHLMTNSAAHFLLFDLC